MRKPWNNKKTTSAVERFTDRAPAIRKNEVARYKSAKPSSVIDAGESLDSEYARENGKDVQASEPRDLLRMPLPPVGRERGAGMPLLASLASNGSWPNEEKVVGIAAYQDRLCLYHFARPKRAEPYLPYEAWRLTGTEVYTASASANKSYTTRKDKPTRTRQAAITATPETSIVEAPQFEDSYVFPYLPSAVRETLITLFADCRVLFQYWVLMPNDDLTVFFAVIENGSKAVFVKADLRATVRLAKITEVRYKLGAPLSKAFESPHAQITSRPTESGLRRLGSR